MKRFICLLCCSVIFVCTTNAQTKGFEKSIEANVGIGLDKYTNYSFGVNFVGGYRANDIFYIGAGLGYRYLDGLYYSNYGGKNDTYKSYDGRSNLNLFARAKINLSRNKVSPFISIDLGGIFGLTSNSIKMANGLLYEPAIGCDIKLKGKQKFYIALGYQGFNYTYKYFNTSYGNTYQETTKRMVGEFSIHLGLCF